MQMLNRFGRDLAIEQSLDAAIEMDEVIAGGARLFSGAYGHDPHASGCRRARADQTRASLRLPIRNHFPASCGYDRSALYIHGAA